ncbi:MAG TPA: preprotein translocase subunit SecE [Terriglobales bacterium]|nr:preprotein translocase subunit SecE [Terriglobales bacterium]
MAKSATAQPSVAEGMGNKVKGSWGRMKSFYGDVRNEMRKVTSPSRKEVQATTVVVIITVFVFGAYFWAVDTVIGHGIDRLLRYFSPR